MCTSIQDVMNRAPTLNDDNIDNVGVQFIASCSSERGKDDS